MADGGFYIREYSHRIDTIDCDDSIVGLFIPMTNTEINEQVARKLGWKAEIVGFVDDPIPGAPCQKVALYQNTPDYAGSIQAAWEIWDHFNEMATLTKHNGKWILSYGRRFSIEADTAPLAICLAFLKLEDK